MKRRLRNPQSTIPNPVKLVIFDLDGTLMNAYPAVYRSVNFTVQKLGLRPISHAVIKRTVGWGDRHLLKTFVGEEQADKALKIYRPHHAKALKRDTKLLPGALKVLKVLKSRNCKIAIASNRPTKFSLIAIRFLKIEGYFDKILCGDKVKRPKPAPEILKTILKDLKVRRCEAFYVGDMGIDVKTGQRAKVKTIAVVSGSSSKAELLKLKPYKVVQRVDQALTFLG